MAVSRTSHATRNVSQGPAKERWNYTANIGEKEGRNEYETALMLKSRANWDMPAYMYCVSLETGKNPTWFTSHSSL